MVGIGLPPSKRYKGESVMIKSSDLGCDPHAPEPISLPALGKSLFQNRRLILQMSVREVLGRYKGSALGVAWSFIIPLFMLTIYTFVFSEIFKARWGGAGGHESKTQFAVLLFAGLIVLNLFNEVINRAPGLIIANVNYVKKYGFPLKYCRWWPCVRPCFTALSA